MKDGTYILDGFTFTDDASMDVFVVSSGLDPGAAEVRTQDVDKPAGDGVWFGRDWLSSPTMSITFGVKNDEQVWDRLGELTNLFRRRTVRTNPGALSTLVFARAGRTYRMWGRCRSFGLKPQPFHFDHYQEAVGTFKLAEPFIELDTLKTVTCRLLEPVGDGGVVFPVVFPVEFRPSSQAREGSAMVGGIAPAHFTVTIKGPVTGQLSQARVYGPGWSISITRPLAYDETVVIDTRRQTVTLNGRSMPGLIGPRDRLDARLSPGSQVLGFEGSDPSGTATAAFSWRDTIPV